MAFTYLIGWSDLDRWYYGYSTKSPDKLWRKYHTSSDYVGAFRLQHGEPDVVRVHLLFDTKKQAHDHEIKFLKRVHAVKSDRWINRSDGINFRSPDKYTDESRAKMSASAKGRIPWNKGIKGVVKQTPESIAKRVAKTTGMKRTEETKAKMSLAKKGKPNPKGIAILIEANKKRKELGLPGNRKGIPNSPESRAKMSKSLKGKPAWNKGIPAKPKTDEWKAAQSNRLKLAWAKRKKLNTIE